MPQEEEELLESMHAVLEKVFDYRLIFPPVAAPTSILDCGCGSGNWAIDVAEEYPDSEVRIIDRFMLALSTGFNPFPGCCCRYKPPADAKRRPRQPRISDRRLEFKVRIVSRRIVSGL